VIEWNSVDDLRLVELPGTGEGLVLAGLEGCSPCEKLLEIVTSVKQRRPEMEVMAAKMPHGGGERGDRVILAGEKVRVFPALVGTRDGAVVFRRNGIATKSGLITVDSIEAAFCRRPGRAAADPTMLLPDQT
jgi:hypothetical protein